ncbi:sensor histidine kinase [Spirosoma soli]|uniref:Sensor histidine kinase n=1 Tax=Spirosoma soli TaxID=1770529 RepID=A0ABW5LX75_9BACT
MKSRQRNIYKWVALSWVALGLLYGMQQYLFYALEGITCNFWGTLVHQVPTFLLWSLYTLLIFKLNVRFPLEDTFKPSLVVIHVGTATVLASLHSLFLGSLQWLWWQCCDASTWAQVITTYSRTWFFFQYIFYGAVFIMINALQAYQQYRTNREQSLLLEKQLTAAELNVLKMQLNPHFLFNALNTVSMLVRGQRNQLATQTITSLSHLLREYIKTHSTQLVPLSHELTNLRRYLGIECIRFSNRFSYHIKVPPELESVLVPDLLLQPLVENAIRHGFEHQVADCRLLIRASLADDQLIIRIEDNGQGFTPAEATYGVGLSNVQQRLVKIYDHQASVQVDSKLGEGTTCTLRIPSRWHELPIPSSALAGMRD